MPHTTRLQPPHAPEDRPPRPMHRHGCRPTQRGVSLVELMVALTVGLVLVAGVLQVLSSSQVSYRLADAQVRSQENGRIALTTLATSLRRTRSFGCRSVLLDERFDSLSVDACDLLSPSDGESGCVGEPAVGSAFALGYDASEQGSANWLAGLPGNASTGGQAAVAAHWLRGDVLVTWGTDGMGVFLEANGSIGEERDAAIDLVADAKSVGINAGKLALLTDCRSTDIFAVTNDADSETLDSLEHAPVYSGTTKNANLDGTLSRAYGLVATNDAGYIETRPTEYRPRVYPFAYDAYFICCMDLTDGALRDDEDAGDCNSDPATYRPALCRWSAGATDPQLLVSDVADLRVTFDGNLDAGAERALDENFNRDTTRRFSNLSGVVTDAAWVTSRGYWDKVDSAVLRLLVTGGEPARIEAASVTDPAPSSANDIGHGLAADRRLYQVLDLNISVRSSSPWYIP